MNFDSDLNAWVDTETGEIVNVSSPEFRVDSQETLEWYLQKRLEAEAEESKFIKLAETLSENTLALAKRQRNRISMLDRLYLADARQFTLSVLEGKRTRTLSTPFGSCAFRRLPARVQVKEHFEEEAIAYLEENVPSLVRVKTMKSIDKRLLPQYTEGLPEDFFTFLPEEDSFTVKGLKGGGE